MAESFSDRRRVDDGRYADDRRRNRPDRRQGPDRLLRLLPWCALGSWVLILGSVLAIAFAKPQTVTFFERAHNLPVRREWDGSLLSLVMGLLVFSFVLGITGLAMNATRHRRKHDVFYLSLAVSSLVAALGFAWVLTL